MEAHKNQETIAHPATSAEERASREAEEKKEAKAAHSKAEHAAPAGKEKAARGKAKNNVRKLRTERMMSKAELARRAGVSVLTVDRVERGMSCRMDTKRKILEALGLRPQDRVMVFGESEDD